MVCQLWPHYLPLLTGHTVTSCMSYVSATPRACVHNSELSPGACLPAWPLPLWSKILFLQLVGECESLCLVCLNSAKEHLLCSSCLHIACVSAIPLSFFFFSSRAELNNLPLTGSQTSNIWLNAEFNNLRMSFKNWFGILWKCACFASSYVKIWRDIHSWWAQHKPVMFWMSH